MHGRIGDVSGKNIPVVDIVDCVALVFPMLQLISLVVLRILWLVIIAWMQLVHTLVNWHTSMCWRLILWMVNITTFPAQLLFALQREKMMKRLLQEIQCHLQDLAWDNKKLQAHLQMAIKEHHFLESMLSDVEEDHDKAILKIELLEREPLVMPQQPPLPRVALTLVEVLEHFGGNLLVELNSWTEQVQHVREENLRLREVQNKGHWDSTGKNDREDEQITKIPWQSSKNGDLLDKDSWMNKNKPSTGLNPTGLFDPLTPLIFSSNVDNDVALEQRREVAFSQSLFSAMLSLLVGAIIWTAEDPCFPLVMALFTVVALSLRSVVHFFSTIKNRPASDAVALLSFNWFILGALACPTFPRFARLLSSIFGCLSDGIFT
ncbi:hypothetical protein Cgig2_021980 [Carnegiea gigantea]|uniref:Uncharacterized protein n=1 Tax=Carnegiea gigantea TaxID=171969 RepID=A0A9Q1KTH4_9CARY|nr:hypothetical protein Cgig2_021980 [Carnegiea gigantea]